MAEVDLLADYPRILRPIWTRTRATAGDRAIASRFGKEYFDGSRIRGYGGYAYDGRWQPIAKRIVEHYKLPRESRILDVGCAKGFLVHDLNALGMRAYGIDISQYAIEHGDDGMSGSHLHVGTADALPWGWKSFDLAVSINTLHNLPLERCKKAIRELMRVSRRQFIQVDSWFTEEQHQAFERWQLTAQTYFNPDGWRALFAEVGYVGDYYFTITE